MRIRSFGQSAFLLEAAVRVAIDPFGDLGPLRQRGLRFDYPPIEQIEAELLLVTHEHQDNNAVEAIGGSPQLIRSTAGRFDTPAGELIAIASEHDDAAGTERAPNTIFAFTLDGLPSATWATSARAYCGPSSARRSASSTCSCCPVGGGPTIDGEQAAALVRGLAPRLVFPMHYRTDAIDFLEPADAFLQALAGLEIEQLGTSECETDDLLRRHPTAL